MKKIDIQAPSGKLGVLIVGLNGAVASTFIAGTYAVSKNMAKPIGSITQLATIRMGQRNENRFPKIKDVVPLAGLDRLVFGGWDIQDENVYDSIVRAEVLVNRDFEPLREELQKLRPMKAVFDQHYVTRLHATHAKTGATKWDLMEQLRQDIRDFKKANQCERLVMIWCGSTEIFLRLGEIHLDLSTFEQAMKDNHIDVAPSMIYAYASLAEKVPFINGAPNLTADIPALLQFADEQNLPVCGKDFKSGQTMLKTVLAPMLKTRMLGLTGWFSTNILGNRDGEVLDDPDSFKTKEECKLNVIDTILQPELYPELYGDVYHKVRINYYPPRKDSKEAWDNIDLFGWLGYPMQLKTNFHCRDSILAAPFCLDLVLFTDLAQRCGFKGIQHWLSFYFKSPMHEANQHPEHDLFIQSVKLKNTLRMIINEKPIDFIDETIDLFR
jgi:myo-inositol-1-phosphate synthase